MTTVAGRRLVGAARATEAQAAADYDQLRERARWLPVQILGLGDLLEHVAQAAADRGVPARTVELGYRTHARYLLRYWRPETPVAEITMAELLWFVRTARAAGRSPNTLIQKDLPLLGRAFLAAGMPNPIPELRRQLRQTLKPVPPAMHYLEPGEIRSILRRMRRGRFRRAQAACPRCHATIRTVVEEGAAVATRRCQGCRRRVRATIQQVGGRVSLARRRADADLVELLALTGIRAGELGRIRIADVDRRRGRIRIASKDRGHPRHADIIAPLAPIVDRLVQAAQDAAGGHADPGDVYLVPNSMVAVTALCRRWKDRLEEPRLSGRTLRHSFVTGLLYSGAEVVEVRGLAGHRNLSTTDRYVHEITGKRALALTAWARTLREDPDAPRAPAAATQADESPPPPPDS